MSGNLQLNSNFRLKTCEMHTCGEPVRIIESIDPPINYEDKCTVLEKKQLVSEKYDFIRQMVILEPRGHKDMFGVIVTEPDKGSSSEFGLIFLNNKGYASMCGHVTIAMGRYLLEKNFIEKRSPETEIRFDCPCGTVKVAVEWDGKVVGNTKFLSVPAFVQNIDYKIFVPELEKTINCDIAFGGNFYGIVTDMSLGVSFEYDSPAKIVDSANFLFDALSKNVILSHPSNKEMEYLYGILVVDSKNDNTNTNILCVFGIKSFDRSPCGSGSTALVATEYFKGNLKLNQRKITQNPFLGEKSTFKCTAIEEITLKSTDIKKKCITVQVSGKAYFTGENLLTYENDDDLKFGFIV